MEIEYAPVDAGIVQSIRRTRVDSEARPVAERTAEGGEYCRCCLSNAREGEPLLLASVDVGLPPESPYRLRSAVFIHADDGCTLGPRDAYPADWIDVRQVVRGYDARGWITTAGIHDGTDPAEVISQTLSHPEVVLVTSGNVLHGCHMFCATTRGGLC